MLHTDNIHLKDDLLEEVTREQMRTRSKERIAAVPVVPECLSILAKLQADLKKAIEDFMAAKYASGEYWQAQAVSAYCLKLLEETSIQAIPELQEYIAKLEAANTRLEEECTQTKINLNYICYILNKLNKMHDSMVKKLDEYQQNEQVLLREVNI